jgi:sterol desaturase/sphingolipid hydroxylase (fatty acid hydroxylase superfamily)
VDHLTRSPTLIGIMLLAGVVELAWRLRTDRGYDRIDAWASVRLAVGHVVFAALNAVLIGLIFAQVSRVAPLHWSTSDWRTWAVGFFLVEFAYYWFHRLSHSIRWMWATHIVHHSTEELTLLSSLRLGWTNVLSGGWIIYVPLVLAGFDLSLVLTILAIDLQFQFFLHTDAPIGLGPLEWVLNTPAHHRVHHAVDEPFLDKNYGGMLIIFDRMFGTFAEARPGEKLRYGLVHPLRSKSTLGLAFGGWRQLFADMRRAPTIGSALRMAASRP